MAPFVHLCNTTKTTTKWAWGRLRHLHSSERGCKKKQKTKKQIQTRFKLGTVVCVLWHVYLAFRLACKVAFRCRGLLKTLVSCSGLQHHVHASKPAKTVGSFPTSYLPLHFGWKGGGVPFLHGVVDVDVTISTESDHEHETELRSLLFCKKSTCVSLRHTVALWVFGGCTSGNIANSSCLKNSWSIQFPITSGHFVFKIGPNSASHRCTNNFDWKVDQCLFIVCCLKGLCCAGGQAADLQEAECCHRKHNTSE